MLHLLARLMSISSHQEDENAALRAMLAEREKDTTYADMLQENRNSPNGVWGIPSVDALQATPQPPSPVESPAWMDHAMLFYLRTRAPNASYNIKVILKKYFEPYRWHRVKFLFETSEKEWHCHHYHFHYQLKDCRISRTQLKNLS